MKKLVIGAVVLSICTCLLCGCSSKPQDSSASASGSQSESQTLTVEELQQYFQQAFDARGNALDTPEQIVLELAEVKNLLGETSLLPEDYETRYKEWRKEHIESLLNTLHEEYAQMILQDTKLVEIWDDSTIYYGPAGMEMGRKPCRADYIDFDGDGFPELLTTAMDYSTYFVTLKIYGGVDGHTLQIAEKTFEIVGRSFGYSLVQDSDLIPYICFSTHDVDGEYTCYYGLIDNEWTPVDELREVVSSFAQNEEDVGWHSFDKKITDSEYQAIIQKYDYIEDILSGDYQTGVTLVDHGILSAFLAISIDLNGKLLTFDNDAVFIENGNVMAPMEPIIAEMGIAFYSNPNRDTFLFSTKSDTFEVYDSGRPWGIKYNEYYMQFNQDDLRDSAMPRLVEDKMLYPVNIIMESFGINVSWDKDIRTLFISGYIPTDKQMNNEELEKIVNFSLSEAIAIIEKQGYDYKEYDWDSIARFRFGKKYWVLSVLLKGDTLQIYDEFGFDTNLLYVEVANDGELVWE